MTTAPPSLTPPPFCLTSVSPTRIPRTCWIPLRSLSRTALSPSPVGTNSATCARSLAFEIPQWGVTCVPGCKRLSRALSTSCPSSARTLSRSAVVRGNRVAAPAAIRPARTRSISSHDPPMCTPSGCCCATRPLAAISSIASAAIAVTASALVSRRSQGKSVAGQMGCVRSPLHNCSGRCIGWRSTPRSTL